ncbi:hypothetical protein Scep_012915 [Stephania cephalantha]|uniref:Uncharacterized protein n=1 Tax=Stephania cephalantha TaxID=152367 RepID=A0AAP0P6X1_9MAGN
MMRRCTTMWRVNVPEDVSTALGSLGERREDMQILRQFGMTMDGAGLSQPQPPPPPPHEQQKPQTDPADPPHQHDNVDREMQDWLTRDEQLGDT